MGAFRRRRVEVDAVRGLSLTIEPGSLVGYLGPNGAGKSTTVKMLTGILVPTSGRVRVLGLDPARERIALARRIGVMFGQRVQLWWDLPLADSFELLRHIYRVPADRYRANLDRFRELLDLDAFLATPVRQLSLGQRIRGELVASMLHDPEVLFLDEPTIGLDVVAKARVREFLAEINRERGVTILLTTHDLGDIERLCDRLLVLDRGALIYDGSLTTLKERYGDERTLVVDLEEEPAAARRAGRNGGPRRGPAAVAPVPAGRDHGRPARRSGRRAGPAGRPRRRGSRHRGHRAADLCRAAVDTVTATSDPNSMPACRT